MLAPTFLPLFPRLSPNQDKSITQDGQGLLSWGIACPFWEGKEFLPRRTP